MSLLQKPRPELVLASASKTRHGLLRQAGLFVRPCPSDVDESAVKRAARERGAAAAATALQLAEMKARAAPASDAIIIGADQLLTCEGRWFDKPDDLASAREHLLALRGRSHVLHTAVSLARGGQIIWRHVAQPSLCMRSSSICALDTYLILLCHKNLASIRRRLSGLETLARGGGLWVSDRKHAAANHGSLAMSRRSRRR